VIDDRAELEDERDFLLRSIEDLDREFEAGDLDEVDYRALRDDYTARAAAVLHELQDEPAPETGPDRSDATKGPWRGIAVAVAVCAVAGLAGWAVARSAGDRSGDEQATGGIAQSLGQQLSNCLIASQSGEEPIEVLECYDAILEEHPANAEALTYKGWFLVRVGLPQLAWADLAEAASVAPEYPDARVFRAVALNNMCRPEEAAAELEVFESLDPLPEMTALVESFALPERIAALQEARDAVPEVAGAPTPIDEVPEDERIQCDRLFDAGVLDPVDAEGQTGTTTTTG
jgi:tetratricopeptide (TPR) repeat protein